jgi:hypothetical protein
MGKMLELVQDIKQDILKMISINTTCTMLLALMLVIEVANLAYSVAHVLLSRCTQLRKESFLTV